jgi:hypothetical protein
MILYLGNYVGESRDMQTVAGRKRNQKVADRVATEILSEI